MVAISVQKRNGAGSLSVFLLAFGILAMSNCAAFLIGWLHSADLRAWWPLAIAMQLLASFGYAMAFTAVASIAGTATTTFSIVYNSVAAFTLLAHAAVFYMHKFDWDAATRDCTLQSVFYKAIHSDAAPYAIYGVFLVGAVLVGSFRRRLS